MLLLLAAALQNGMTAKNYCGEVRAREMFFSAGNIDASEALKAGLINGLSTPEDLQNLCLSVARRVSEIPIPLVSAWKTGAVERFSR